MTETQPKQLSFTSREEMLRLIQEAFSSGKLTVLDVFCGIGGVSDGYSLEGFDVTGIDIVDAPKLLDYKHRFIQADMLSLKGEDFKGYDVIWGSPPCRDFTQLPDHAYWKSGRRIAWKRPKQPENGLKLIRTFLQFVKGACPKFWILENVMGLANHLNMKPAILGGTTSLRKKHVFYGNFPTFLLPNQRRNTPIDQINGKLRSWERAKIPLACSRAFAKACKEALQQ